VVLSQALLNSSVNAIVQPVPRAEYLTGIIANQEIAHVFAVS
jgi:hypothetical protein